jgi:hypothetical protein
MHSILKLGIGLGVMAGVAAVPAAPASAANLVTNGGFETGSFSGWTFTGDTVDDFVDNGTASGLSPYSGTYFAALGSTGEESKLTQDIATTPGQTYSLSFELVSDGQTGPANVQNFEAQFAGEDLILPSYANTSYEKFILNGTATSSNSLLTFTFRDDPGYSGLDDVSVVSGAAAVPEASSFVSFGLLALAGLGALMVRARRQQTQP